MEVILYGLDAAGETLFSEVLKPADRSDIQRLGRERLARCHAVEVWDGPLCVLRLRGETPTPSQPA